MTKLTDRAFALSFAQAIPVLLKACGLRADARLALAARIRQLQRLGLETPGTPSSRKPGYGLLELAELATAVQMMAAFVMPKFASRYLIEQRSEFLPFYLAGALNAVPDAWREQRRLSDKCYALLPRTALADLGKTASRDKKYAGELGKVLLFSDCSLADVSTATGGAGVILDSSVFMPALVRAALNAAFATEEELGWELDRIYFGMVEVSPLSG